MAKCNGNCAICTIQTDENKQACCSVQLLKNLLEVKALIKDISQRLLPSDFSALAPIDDAEPIASGPEEYEQ